MIDMRLKECVIIMSFDDFVSTLKFVPDWFVTSKMIKKLFTVLYTDDNILFLINIPHFFVTKWVFLL